MKTILMSLFCLAIFLSVTSCNPCKKKIPGVIETYEECVKQCEQEQEALLNQLNACKKEADDELKKRMNICMHVAPENRDACISDAVLDYWEKVQPCYETYWESRQDCKDACINRLLMDMKTLAN